MKAHRKLWEGFLFHLEGGWATKPWTWSENSTRKEFEEMLAVEDIRLTLEENLMVGLFFALMFGGDLNV